MATADSTRTRRAAHLRLIPGGKTTSPRRFAEGRAAAAAAIVVGYERALEVLDPDDAAERLWYAERLRDAQLIASYEDAAAGR